MSFIWDRLCNLLSGRNRRLQQESSSLPRESIVSCNPTRFEDGFLQSTALEGSSVDLPHSDERELAAPHEATSNDKQVYSEDGSGTNPEISETHEQHTLLETESQSAIESCDRDLQGYCKQCDELNLCEESDLHTEEQELETNKSVDDDSVTTHSISQIIRPEVPQFLEPVPEEYVCPICFEVLHQPVTTNCCGQRYCQACIEMWVVSLGKQSCPTCRFNIDANDLALDEGLACTINSLEVRCTSLSNGCNWTGKWECLEHHLSNECISTQLRLALLPNSSGSFYSCPLPLTATTDDSVLDKNVAFIVERLNGAELPHPSIYAAVSLQRQLHSGIMRNLLKSGSAFPNGCGFLFPYCNSLGVAQSIPLPCVLSPVRSQSFLPLPEGPSESLKLGSHNLVAVLASKQVVLQACGSIKLYRTSVQIMQPTLPSTSYALLKFALAQVCLMLQSLHHYKMVRFQSFLRLLKGATSSPAKDTPYESLEFALAHVKGAMSSPAVYASYESLEFTMSIMLQLPFQSFLRLLKGAMSSPTKDTPYECLDFALAHVKGAMSSPTVYASYESLEFTMSIMLQLPFQSFLHLLKGDTSSPTKDTPYECLDFALAHVKGAMSSSAVYVSDESLEFTMSIMLQLPFQSFLRLLKGATSSPTKDSPYECLDFALAHVKGAMTSPAVYVSDESLEFTMSIMLQLSFQSFLRLLKGATSSPTKDAPYERLDFALAHVKGAMSSSAVYSSDESLEFTMSIMLQLPFQSFLRLLKGAMSSPTKDTPYECLDFALAHVKGAMTSPAVYVSDESLEFTMSIMLQLPFQSFLRLLKGATSSPTKDSPYECLDFALAHVKGAMTSPAVYVSDESLEFTMSIMLQLSFQSFLRLLKGATSSPTKDAPYERLDFALAHVKGAMSSSAVYSSDESLEFTMSIMLQLPFQSFLRLLKGAMSSPTKDTPYECLDFALAHVKGAMTSPAVYVSDESLEFTMSIMLQLPFQSFLHLLKGATSSPTKDTPYESLDFALAHVKGAMSSPAVYASYESLEFTTSIMLQLLFQSFLRLLKGATSSPTKDTPYERLEFALAHVKGAMSSPAVYASDESLEFVLAQMFIMPQLLFQSLLRHLKGAMSSPAKDTLYESLDFALAHVKGAMSSPAVYASDESLEFILAQMSIMLQLRFQSFLRLLKGAMSSPTKDTPYESLDFALAHVKGAMTSPAVYVSDESLEFTMQPHQACIVPFQSLHLPQGACASCKIYEFTEAVMSMMQQSLTPHNTLLVHLLRESASSFVLCGCYECVGAQILFVQNSWNTVSFKLAVVSECSLAFYKGFECIVVQMTFTPQSYVTPFPHTRWPGYDTNLVHSFALLPVSGSSTNHSCMLHLVVGSSTSSRLRLLVKLTFQHGYNVIAVRGISLSRLEEAALLRLHYCIKLLGASIFLARNLSSSQIENLLCSNFLPDISTYSIVVVPSFPPTCEKGKVLLGVTKALPKQKADFPFNSLGQLPSQYFEIKGTKEYHHKPHESKCTVSQQKSWNLTKLLSSGSACKSRSNLKRHSAYYQHKSEIAVTNATQYIVSGGGGERTSNANRYRCPLSHQVVGQKIPMKFTPQSDGRSASKSSSKSRNSSASQNPRKSCSYQSSCYGVSLGRQQALGGIGNGGDNPDDNNQNRRRLKSQCEADSHCLEGGRDLSSGGARNGRPMKVSEFHLEEAPEFGGANSTQSHPVSTDSHEKEQLREGKSNNIHHDVAVSSCISGNVTSIAENGSTKEDQRSINDERPHNCIIHPLQQLDLMKVECGKEHHSSNQPNIKHHHSQGPIQDYQGSREQDNRSNPIPEIPERFDETVAADVQQSEHQILCDENQKEWQARSETASASLHHAHSKELPFEEAVCEEAFDPSTTCLVLSTRKETAVSVVYVHSLPIGIPELTTLQHTITTFVHFAEQSPHQSCDEETVVPPPDFPSHEMTINPIPRGELVPGCSINTTPFAEQYHPYGPATGSLQAEPSLLESASKTFQSACSKMNDERLSEDIFQESAVLPGDQSLDLENTSASGSLLHLQIKFPSSVDECETSNCSEVVTGQHNLFFQNIPGSWECEAVYGVSPLSCQDTCDWMGSLRANLWLRCRLPVHICAEHNYPPSDGCRLPTFMGMCAQSGCLRRVMEVLLSLVQCKTICHKYGHPFAAVPLMIWIDPTSGSVMLHPLCLSETQTTEDFLFTVVVGPLKLLKDIWMQSPAKCTQYVMSTEVLCYLLREVEEYCSIISRETVDSFMLHLLSTVFELLS